MKEQWLVIGRLPRMAQCKELRVEPIASDNPKHALLSRLLGESCVRHRMRLHADEWGRPPDLEVRRIEEIRNPRLWRMYFTKLEESALDLVQTLLGEQ